ncbi:MAG: GYD domain-containing protein [Thermodesulfobacteriota bacterium]
MATFLMFGKYSAEGVKGISPQRTQNATDLIKKYGGQVKAMYAMLGMADLLLIVDLPGVEAAMQTSVALSKQTGISFCSSPAITVEEFDKLKF